MGTDPLLVIDGLRVRVTSDGRPRGVVKDVSLSVAAGEVLCLIGESGCGKSMTCLAVMGLLPATAGIIGGSIRYGERTDIRRGRDVAMIMQNPSSCFDPVFTIKSHFRETLSAQGLSFHANYAKVLQTIAEAGFDDPEAVLPLYPFQMSGGMLQRVMIALAMVAAPGVILADEPTTDLDMPAQAMVLDLIDRLRRSHDLGMLLVTHDLSVVARMADTVAVMRDGAILETGPARRVFDSPEHPYTRTLLEAHFALHDAFVDPGKDGVAA
jgi:nickel transport system ATP-binding protein